MTYNILQHVAYFYLFVYLETMSLVAQVGFKNNLNFYSLFPKFWLCVCIKDVQVCAYNSPHMEVNGQPQVFVLTLNLI